MQKIEEIVGEVLDAMRRRGLREYTLKHENWSIYRPIINWHHKMEPSITRKNCWKAYASISKPDTRMEKSNGNITVLL